MPCFVLTKLWYMLYCTVLYCTILYFTVQCCTLLYCTVLYCTMLYCTVLYCTVLFELNYNTCCTTDYPVWKGVIIHVISLSVLGAAYNSPQLRLIFSLRWIIGNSLIVCFYDFIILYCNDNHSSIRLYLTYVWQI